MAKSKQELDKDLMFSKIMPALSDNPFSNVYDTHKTPTVEDLPLEKDDSLSALRDKLFARSSTYLEEETVATINIMETLVLRNVDAVIKRFNTCHCDRCRCDMVALALNNLPAKYIVDTPQKINEFENEISASVVNEALIKAVIQVRSKPRH